jgi:regulator of replication initiation timing
MLYQNMNFVINEDSKTDAIEKMDLIIAELQEENARLRMENARLIRVQIQWLIVWLSFQF